MFFCNSVPVFGTANKSCVICVICFILHEFTQKRVFLVLWLVILYLTVFILLLVLSVRMPSPCCALVLKCAHVIWQPETVICHFVTFTPTEFTDGDGRLVNLPLATSISISMCMRSCLPPLLPPQTSLSLFIKTSRWKVPIWC